MAVGQGRSEFCRPARLADGGGVERLYFVRARFVGRDRCEHSRQRGMRQREIGIARDRQLVIGFGAAVGLLVLGQIVERASAQISFIGRDIASAARSRRVGRHLHRHCVRDRPRNFGFEREDIAQGTLRLVAPFAEAGAAVGEVGRHRNPVAGPLHRPLEKVGNAQPARDRLRIARHVRDRVGGSPGEHHEAAVARQGRADLVGQSIRQVGLAGIAAEVLERQDRDASGLR